MILEGKRAIVTGGSRGIGNAIVREFLREGATVYAVSRTQPENVAQLEAEACDESRFFWRQADVTQQEEIAGVVEKIVAEAGGIEILIDNAGITRDGLIFRMPTADWEDVLRANLTSAFHASRIVARFMIMQRAGSIVNISSVAGIMGNTARPITRRRKRGSSGFPRAWRARLPPAGSGSTPSRRGSSKPTCRRQSPRRRGRRSSPRFRWEGSGLLRRWLRLLPSWLLIRPRTSRGRCSPLMAGCVCDTRYI